MSLRYALLGLLSERPASGYALTQRFEQSLQKYAWHANHSQIYPELAKLAADDLATVVEEGARGRRTYAITDAGRQALRDWLLTPNAGPRRVRNESVLRLFLVSTLELDQAAGLLRGYVERAERDLAELRTVVGYLESSEDADEPLQFGRLAAEFGLRQNAAFHDWAQWALARVEKGSSSGQEDLPAHGG